MISCKSYLIYGGSIYFGGILGNSVASCFVEFLNLKKMKYDPMYYDIYRRDLHEFKYSFFGIIVGSCLGFLVGKKINNFNFVQSLKITN